MISFEPNQLAAWTGGHWTATPVAPLVGFTMDTRQLKTGQVFVALKTEQRDGHDFLEAAVVAGASAAVVSREDKSMTLPQLVVPDPLIAFQTIARQHRQKFTGPVVGVSGSVGKTSTKNLLGLLLGGEEKGVLVTKGNLNNHIGVPLTLTQIDPEIHKCAVIEAGISGPGEMAPLATMIEPDLVIITLVAPAHVDALGSIEGVAQEKAVLSKALRVDGMAIYPRQCDEFAVFGEAQFPRLVIERVEVINSTEPPKNRVCYTTTHGGNETVLAVIYRQPQPLVFTLRRVSDGMAQNAVLAICSALRLGVSYDLVQKRIAEWSPASMRGELFHEEGKLIYVDCYNANPASMTDALETFYSVAPEDQPRLLILGGMEELGAESAMFHRALGRSLRLRVQDEVYMIGDHAEALREGALEAGVALDRAVVFATTESIQPNVEKFRGAVFLKGSRRYQLETLLKTAPATPAHA